MTNKRDSVGAVYDDIAGDAAWAAASSGATNLENASEPHPVDPRFFGEAGETGNRPDDDGWAKGSGEDEGRRRRAGLGAIVLGAGAALVAVFFVRRAHRQASPAERIKAKARGTAHSLSEHGLEIAGHTAAHAFDVAGHAAAHGRDIAEHKAEDVKKRVRRAVA